MDATDKLRRNDGSFAKKAAEAMRNRALSARASTLRPLPGAHRGSCNRAGIAVGGWLGEAIRAAEPDLCRQISVAGAQGGDDRRRHA